MSPNQFGNTVHRVDISDEEISEALTALWRLSPESVDRVLDTMRIKHMSFIDAATYTGVVTAKEAEEAVAWVRNRASASQSNVIETALNRQERSRQTPVKVGEQVRPDRQLILAHDPYNDRSERIRALRTELLLLLSDNNHSNTIAVLSPGTGEGRSQLAAELAIAFSQLGRRTLLVDGDLRHPCQQVLFGATDQWGFAQALAFGEHPPLYTVEGLPHLWLLTAGPLVPNPLELLSSQRMERLVNDWRYQYDFVIIDTPPSSQYADGLAIATVAGYVLMLSRAQHTPFSAMKDLLRRLSTTQSRVLGAVLNSF